MGVERAVQEGIGLTLDYEIWYFPIDFLVEKLFSPSFWLVKCNFTTVGHPWRNAFDHHLEKSSIGHRLAKILSTPMAALYSAQ